MTKEDQLNIIKLLSALESWGFSTNQTMPAYLYDQMQTSIVLLCKEVLKHDT